MKEYMTKEQSNSYNHMIIQGYEFVTIILNSVYMRDRVRFIKIDAQGVVNQVHGELL